MPLILPLLLASSAVAGPFTRKATMEDWPERQVERPMVLPKGWLQVGLGVDHKTSTAGRGRAGSRQAFEDGVAFRYSRMWLRVDQGFSKRIRLYARAPMVRAALNRDGDSAVATTALGDTRGGFFFQPVLDKPFSWALQGELKAPTGVEWPGATDGGPANTTGFLTGTGTTDLSAHLHGQARIEGGVLLHAQAGYEARLPGVVGYVYDPDTGGNGWLNPGDVWHTRLDGTVQLGDDIALTAGGTARFVGWYRTGVSGPSVWTAELYDVPASYGTWVDVDGRLSYEPDEHFEVAGWASWQATGAYTGVFSHLGLDDYSPLPGLTIGVDLVSRW